MLNCTEPENENLFTYRPSTIEDWLRCRNFIAPDKLNFTCLPENEINQIIEKNYEIICAAAPFMEHLSNKLAGKPHVIALADKDAWIIALYGTPEYFGGKNTGICVGASWAEKNIGNNGIGTALVRKEPVLIYGIEHYGTAYKSVACTGIPIKNKNNEITGALDISVPVEFSCCDILTMALACVNSIENKLYYNTSNVDSTIAKIDFLERLNIVGEMAKSMSHEIRNPMTTVYGMLQLLQEKKEFEGYRGEFKLMLEELNTINSIISEYLIFAENRPMNLEIQNLNSLIKDTLISIQKNDISRDKIINFNPGNIPDQLVDKDEISRLIYNLVINGLEAMPTGTVLTVETLSPGSGEILMNISDQGPQIPPEIFEKLGTPFFTNKNDNNRGLGLALCYSIAQKHSASIKPVTGPSGTTFTVRFNIS